MSGWKWDAFASEAEAEVWARSLPGEAAEEVEAAGGNPAPDAPWAQEWIAPGPVAEAFYWSDDMVCLLRGPVGSGKTTTNMRKPFRRALTMPRSTIDGVRYYKTAIVRQTYRQLWQTTIPSWFETVPKNMGKWAGGRGDPVTHTIRFEDAHGPIEFIAEFLAFGESPAEIEANLRGLQTTDMNIEEADTTLVDLFSTAVGRINRYPARKHFQGGAFCATPYPREMWSYGQINMTYNAPEEGNWILALEAAAGAGEAEVDAALAADLAQAIRRSAAKVTFFRQPGGREPGAENMGNLAPDYYDAQIMGMRASGRSDKIARLIDNRVGFIRKGDLVFETEGPTQKFNPSVHIARERIEPHPHFPLRIGLDQGFFGAGIVAQLLPGRRWVILAELGFKKRVFARDFGIALRELLDERFPGMSVDGVFADMAGEAQNAAGRENESWNEAVARVTGLDVEPQTYGANRIEPRLNAIRAALDSFQGGQPGLLIDPGCRMLIRAFVADYVWAEEIDKAGNRTTRPKKSGNRAADYMDALGYLLLSEHDGDGQVPVSGQPRGAERRMGHNGGPDLDDGRPGAGRWSTAWEATDAFRPQQEGNPWRVN